MDSSNESTSEKKKRGVARNWDEMKIISWRFSPSGVWLLNICGLLSGWSFDKTLTRSPRIVKCKLHLKYLQNKRKTQAHLMCGLKTEWGFFLAAKLQTANCKLRIWTHMLTNSSLSLSLSVVDQQKAKFSFHCKKKSCSLSSSGWKF